MLKLKPQNQDSRQIVVCKEDAYTCILRGQAIQGRKSPDVVEWLNLTTPEGKAVDVLLSVSLFSLYPQALKQLTHHQKLHTKEQHIPAGANVHEM